MDIRKYIRIVPGADGQGLTGGSPRNGRPTLLVVPDPLSSQGGTGRKRLASATLVADDNERCNKRQRRESSMTGNHLAQPKQPKPTGKRARSEEEGGERESKRKKTEGATPRRPSQAWTKAANGLGAAVAKQFLGGGEVEREQVEAECASKWDAFLQGREDNLRRRHIEVATTTAVNYLTWHRVVVVSGGKGERGQKESTKRETKPPQAERNEDLIVVVWANMLIPISVWRAQLEKVTGEGVVRGVRRVGGDHPRVEVEVGTQHQRDQLVGQLREAWGARGANAVKAGREHRVRVAQRVQREWAGSKEGCGGNKKRESEEEGGKQGERGKARGEGSGQQWQAPKRVTRWQQPLGQTGKGVATHNLFAALTNIDTSPVEHTARERGDGKRRVKAATVNLAGGKRRLAELQRVVETGALNAEVIAVQETWLKGTEVLVMPGFVYFGSNRRIQGVRGEGGVGVFVAEHLVAAKVGAYQGEEEWLWVKIGMRKGKPLFICSIYGPQESEKREVVRGAFGRLGQQVAELQEKGHVMILGDLNAKLGNSGKRVGVRAMEAVSQNGTVVRQLLEEQGLWSLVDRDEPSSGPTYFATGVQSTIDHALVSGGLWQRKARATVRKDLEIGSDHVPVEAEVTVEAPKRARTNRKPHQRWRVERLEEEGVRRELEEKLRGVEWGEGGTQERWKRWKEKVREAAEAAVGKKRVNRRRVGWWDREMAEAVEKRRAAFHRARATGTQEDWKDFLRQRREAKKTANTKKGVFAAKVGLEVVEAQAVGGKRVWALLKQLGWNPKGSGGGFNIQNSSGNLVSTPEEALNAYADYFEQLGKGPGGEVFDEEHRERVEKELEEWVEGEGARKEEDRGKDPISLEAVEKAIQQAKNGRSAGSSGIPNEVVKGGGGKKQRNPCRDSSRRPGMRRHRHGSGRKG